MGLLNPLRIAMLRLMEYGVPLIAHTKKGNEWKGNRFLNLIEYIESTGTQRIDTGITPGSDYRIVLDVQVSDSQNSEGHFASATGTYYSVLSFRPNQTNWYWTRYYKQALQSFNSSFNSRTRRIIDKNANLTTITLEDGTTQTITSNTGSYNMSYNVNLFCRNASGTFNTFIKMKLFSCQIYKGGELVRDFWPIIDDTTGEAGLINMVDGTFYGNDGTGAFTAGPSV